MHKIVEDTECQQHILGCRRLPGRSPSLRLELHDQHSMSAKYPDWKGRNPKCKLKRATGRVEEPLLCCSALEPSLAS